MENNGEEIKGRQGLIKHVVGFYKDLFGQNAECCVSLGENFWPDHLKLSEEDKVFLVKPFLGEEIKEVIMDMKENSAPGPNGYGLIFFKRFWEILKEDIEDMFKDFWENKLDIKRLNYGVITLIPKLRDANNIDQFAC